MRLCDLSSKTQDESQRLGHGRSRGLGLGVWRVGSVLARSGTWLLGFGFMAVKTRRNLIQSEIPFVCGDCCVGVWDSGFGFGDLGFRVARRSWLLVSGIWDLGSGIWDLGSNFGRLTTVIRVDTYPAPDSNPVLTLTLPLTLTMSLQ